MYMYMYMYMYVYIYTCCVGIKIPGDQLSCLDISSRVLNNRRLRQNPLRQNHAVDLLSIPFRLDREIPSNKQMSTSERDIALFDLVGVDAFSKFYLQSG